MCTSAATFRRRVKERSVTSTCGVFGKIVSPIIRFGTSMFYCKRMINYQVFLEEHQFVKLDKRRNSLQNVSSWTSDVFVEPVFYYGLSWNTCMTKSTSSLFVIAVNISFTCLKKWRCFTCFLYIILLLPATARIFSLTVRAWSAPKQKRVFLLSFEPVLKTERKIFNTFSRRLET